MRINKHFISSTAANVKVIELSDKTAALTQIAAELKGVKNLDAIHIISHGSEGELDFANGKLNSANLSTYKSQLQKIGASLSKDGDILLYGCDVAKGDDGSAFINSLSKLTKADVAASDDLTGASAKGGDWVLEKSTALIEAQAISSQDWNHLLTGTWEAVGSNILGLGQPPKIKISSDNIPYIAYFDYSVQQQNNNYSFAVKSFNTTTSTWDSVGDTLSTSGGGMMTPTIDIELSSTNLPYVAYYDYDNQAATSSVVVKQLNGSTWDTVGNSGLTTSNNGYGGGFVDIELDSTNTPYVAYYDYSGQTSSVVVKKLNTTNSTWEAVGSSGLDSQNNGYGYVDIELDSTNTPYVAYYGYDSSSQTYSVVVKKLNGSTWDVVGSSGLGGQSGGMGNNSVDLEFTSNNTPYVAYYDYSSSNAALTVKKLNGTAWDDAGTGLSSSYGGFNVDLEFAADDTPYIAYSDFMSLSGNAPTQKLNGTTWESVGESTNSSYGFAVGLAIAPNGTIYRADYGSGITVSRYMVSLDLLATSDSGLLDTDNITNDTTPTIRVPISSGGAIETDTVELKLGGSSLSTPQTKVLDANDISAGYVDFTVASGDLGVDGDKVFTADLTHNSSTNPLSGSLTITLDTLAPTASATASQVIKNSANTVVQSNETGIAYLVKNSVTVTDLASITGTADNEFNSVEITLPDTDTNLVATGLVDGTYNVYSVDVAGNLSAVAANTVVVDTTSPTDIALSNSNVDVAGGSDAIVGALSSTDEISSTFTYALVSGDGDTNNGLFNIDGGNLRVAVASSLTGGQTYSVRVQTTDAAGNTFEEALSISAVEAMVVTTNLDTGADATIDGNYATDLTDGGGLSLREALNYVADGGIVRFALPLASTITLANTDDVKAGVTFDADTVGTLTIEGSTLNLVGALNVTNGATDNLTISSNLTTGDGSLVKQGVGNLTLSGTNSGDNAFDGIMTISGGSLTISSDANLGNGYVQIGETGATVNEETRSILKITGSGEQNFDNVIMVGASEGEVSIDDGLIVMLNGKLDEPDLGAGEAGHDLIKTGLGTLILASADNELGLSGDIFVNAGDVQVLSDECLPNGEIYLPDGKDLEFTGGEENTEVNNTINFRGDNASIDAGSKTVTISGEIKGASTFNVKGNVSNGEPVGALVLSGNNDNFTGATNVGTGKLVVNGSMANTANVTVGGTLGGSGTIGTSPTEQNPNGKGGVSISNGGTLAPGNSPGQITLNNGLTLSAGAKLSIQLKTGTIDTNASPKVYGYDQVVVKGAVNITGSNLVLGLENGYSFNDGTVFKIIDNDAADAVTGIFQGFQTAALLQ